ncbi:hypothetical protein Zmor_021216 [Zophobas morio]|uniref:MICOS complex subunit MIC13 n=1 Tax=Zophobas morio TaxID=2755281 RepID=A0AA38MAX6_9CUCU|nr:hypothetical protein Zmor_021216 [Zophobas morio]
MSKSRVCAEKVAKACTKKTNLLVYERKKGDGCQKTKPYVPPISNPQLKRIRICTGAELKKMCPPPPCPCPPQQAKRDLGLLSKLLRILGFGAKSLLAASAIYLTYDMGIWGDSESTGKLYKSICDAVLPNIVEPQVREKTLTPSCQAERELFHMFEKDPYCCDKFPIDHETGVYELQQKWNRMVTATFSSLAGFPARMRNWSHRVYCKMFDSESCKELEAQEEKGECCPCD